MKIVVIGGVTSTRLLLEKLSAHGFKDVHVFGYSPVDTTSVSGWVDLSQLSLHCNYEFNSYVRVSDCGNKIKALNPDLIFAVGLSQLISDELLAIPRLGVIGFHPTALPKGRGRAPIAWLILEQMDGAATFFKLCTGIDDGPIYVQEPFPVCSDDTAATVEAKILEAESKALDKLLPSLATGTLEAEEQDHNSATWFGRRTPDDGWINWHESAISLLQLIRASTHPHPGAYTFHRDHKILIWSAEPVVHHGERGVVGRILCTEDPESFIVQCGNNQLLRVTGWNTSTSWSPKVGELLGYYVEAEIYELRRKVMDLNEKLLRFERFFLK